MNQADVYPRPLRKNLAKDVDVSLANAAISMPITDTGTDVSLPVEILKGRHYHPRVVSNKVLEVPADYF